jgi:hypothetical protein
LPAGAGVMLVKFYYKTVIGYFKTIIIYLFYCEIVFSASYIKTIENYSKIVKSPKAYYKIDTT